MQKIYLFLLFLHLSPACSLMGADSSSQNVAIPMLSAKSSEQEIIEFYKAQGSGLRVSFIYWFALFGQEFFNSIATEYCQTQNKEPNTTRKAYLSHHNDSIKLAKDLLRKTIADKEHANFANLNELDFHARYPIYKQGIKLTQEQELGYRMLLIFELVIEYPAMPDDWQDTLEKEVQRSGCSNASNAIKLYCQNTKKCQDLFLDFTRKHASILNHLGFHESKKLKNDPQFLGFLEDLSQFWFAVSMCENEGSKIFYEGIKPDVQRNLNKNLPKNYYGMEPKINLTLQFDKIEIDFWLEGINRELSKMGSKMYKVSDDS